MHGMMPCYQGCRP